MSSASQIINKAKAELGTKEVPSGSNKVKYNTEYYGRAVSGSPYPWCCVFVWWVFKHTGASSLFYGGKKTALCATLMSWFKSKGRFYTKNPKPGDIVFYNFSGAKTAKHVGIVYTVNSDGSINAIEGNTAVGNESNGGQVMNRNRVPKYILGYGRPDYNVSTVSNDTSTIQYYVRKTYKDNKTQKGAFSSLEYAKNCADSNPGYYVFNKSKEIVYPVNQEIYKTTENLNLRKGVGTSYSIILSMPKGAKVIRISNDNDKKYNGTPWYNVSYVKNSKTYIGYASSKYLKKI